MHFPEAGKIRFVLDNLPNHTPSALHNALPTVEVGRILRRTEFRYTPGHASRLNEVFIVQG